ncbi:LAQU0S04e08482g1_1 [Lachancea quebecensis]|uniref:LAQU0S04e08482g1_1 n=1 Tax=Lachancea quebecensis TaxID=1654605 RepID=A0A0P1KY49_9SACH|nr:LAQU0S04e08482g1_1 [Lachancea quebecensis]
MTMSRKPERRLRPKTPVAVNQDELFDFDKPEYEVSPYRKLNILPRTAIPVLGYQPDETRHTENQELARKTLESRGMTIEVETHVLDALEPSPSDRSSDPLADELYLTFHKKMQKQENRMLNQDRLQSEGEAERLKVIYEELGSSNWVKSLTNTTIVKNPDDPHELELKRGLTKEAIDQMLEKFKDMKSRAMLLPRSGKHSRPLGVSRRIDAYKPPENAFCINASSDEEEELLTLSELKKYRLETRRKRYGGPVVIQFRKSQATSFKYAIVAEPLQSAYIVKCSKEEKEIWSREAESLPAKIEHYAPFPKQYYSAKSATRSTRQGPGDQLAFKAEAPLPTKNTPPKRSSSQFSPKKTRKRSKAPAYGHLDIVPSHR